MALIQSTAIPSGATDYELEQSLRFNDDDSAYLSWTPASAGNRRTWTWSAWIKRSNSSATHMLFFTAVAGDLTEDDHFGIRLDSGASSNIVLTWGDGNTAITNAIFRDPSAWMHIVVAIDTTQGTDTNRVKVYVNGTQQTFSSTDLPSQNFEYGINKAHEHNLGSRVIYGSSANYYDGYMTEVNFLDGVVGTPADFGETGTYGEWKPIEYEGTYGTNGFYLNFAGGGVMSATGGTITTDGDYKVHSFTSNGTFTPSSITGDGYVEYLVIGGGGAGAADGSTTAGNGGGGAGGYRTGYLPVTAQAYSITVGAGGVGTTGSSQVNGANSVFSSITSSGGGGGGYFTSTPGAAGGSGGGGSAQTAAGGAANPAGQGNAGETASNGQGGGGGGGAGEAGGTDGTGQGGDGLASSITGSSVTRAGGGGGSRASGGARAGGTGGGGAGGNGGAGTSGTANTGSGGGAGVSGGSAGSGGSGIVIIRYKFQ